jgi:tetratricopeptide (TPR) repeat protein
VSQSLMITAALLVLFYLGVFLLPRFVHWVAARSLYNYRDRANEAIVRGDYDGAVAVIERAAREIPRDIYFERPEYMLDWIGRIRKQEARTTESLQAFLRAQANYFRNIDLRGYFPPTRLIHDIIESYFTLKNFGGVYAEARLALDLYPMVKDQFLKPHTNHQADNPIILRDAGVLCIKTGRVADAQARLRQSLADNPRLPDSHYWLARIEEEKRSTDSAVREYEAELAVNPYGENALLRLIRMRSGTEFDTAPLARRLDKIRSLALAEYSIPTTTSIPLASLWGIGSKLELTLNLPQPGPLVFNVLAWSTPCYGLYGWLEFTLDDRHIQNVYVESQEPRVYSVYVDRVEAGPHSFRLDVLSDASDGKEDRNTFIQSICVYRPAVGSP